MNVTYLRTKRAVDVCVSLIMLIITTPIQLVIAVLVRVDLGAPVLFRQARPGRDERIFELVKFRTMRDLDETGGLTTDDERLTPFGAALRSTSLDELPTLWNVLRGDMSLVGPRPLLVRYLDRYTSAQRGRHAVRPGITGLAQVAGRNAISWEQKFSKDLEYIETIGALTDAKILVRTIGRVLRRDGIADGDTATMTEFGLPGNDAR